MYVCMYVDTYVCVCRYHTHVMSVLRVCPYVTCMCIVVCVCVRVYADVYIYIYTYSAKSK